MRGIVFAKQFPNPAEPLRGSFVVDQMLATRDSVEWRAIAPVPWIPRLLAGPMRKPYVRGASEVDGIPVARPRYPVLPARRLYTSVAPAMALASRAAFRRAVVEHAPDFVHVHALYPSGAALRRLAQATKVPYIVSIHGSDLYSNLVRDSWAAALGPVVADAAAIVCVSGALRRDAIERIGADPSRTVLIPDAFDDARYALAGREARSGPVRFVTVGRLVPEKGHDALIRALALARGTGLDAELVIVGSGPELASLRAQAESQGVASVVSFRGAVPRDNLPRELAAADAFVLPSLREGFGVALVEALATGLPAVATRSGGPEDILSAEDGLLVEPGDPEALAAAMSRLAASLDSHDRAAIAGRAKRRFGRAAVATRLVALYSAVLEGRVAEHASREVNRV